MIFEHLDIGGHTATRQQWEALLAAVGLKTDPPYSSVYGIFDKGRLVATGARDHNRLKCVAVDPELQGGSLFSQLLTGIIAHAFDLGINKLYLYAKPAALTSFGRVGFHPLVSSPEGVTLMERGRPSFDQYLEERRLETEDYDRNYGRPKGSVESLVIRSDPFTAPEIALAAEAADRADRVHLFVMGGEKAMNRLRERTGQLRGVIYHPAQGYFIPAGLFPSYHLADREEAVKTQAALDALLLRDRFAPVLGITGRTVLEDPSDPHQLLYNRTTESFLSPGLSLTRLTADRLS